MAKHCTLFLVTLFTWLNIYMYSEQKDALPQSPFRKDWRPSWGECSQHTASKCQFYRVSLSWTALPKVMPFFIGSDPMAEQGGVWRSGCSGLRGKLYKVHPETLAHKIAGKRSKTLKPSWRDFHLPKMGQFE